MKKKILIILISCVLALSCVGCNTTYQDAVAKIEIPSNDFASGYFTAITEWGDAMESYKIVYANDTKVKYMVAKSSHFSGITPLYNPDGTLQIYDIK